MPEDRPSRSRRPSGGPAKRGGGSGSARPGGPRGSRPSGGRPGRGPGRPDGAGRGSQGGRSGRPGGKPGSKPGGRPGARSGRPPRDRDAEQRPDTRTAAQRRADEVRKTRGPRRTQNSPEREQAKIEGRQVEQWIDEGALRDEAIAATARAARPPRERGEVQIDPEVVAEIHAALDPQRARRLADRLAMASQALDRERFDEARRITYALAKELPTVAAVHEVHGLASYRMGRWKQAAASLELARQLRRDPALLPVLADCYRALHRWLDVESVWRDLKSASPDHETMTEGRIVMAGAMADRGDLKGAIKLLLDSEKPPKRVREHHLRQWYVLGDLHDRAGDVVGATRWFRHVAAVDGDFADVHARLRALGR